MGTEPVTKAKTAYLSTEGRKDVKIRGIEANWGERSLILQLELDKKYEQYIAYIAQVSCRYTIQEADELVGKLALRRIRSDQPGHAGAVRTSCLDWQLLAMVDRDPVQIADIRAIAPPSALDRQKYLLDKTPSIFNTGRDKPSIDERRKARRQWRRLNSNVAVNLTKAGRDAQTQAIKAAKSTKAAKSRVRDQGRRRAYHSEEESLTAMAIDSASNGEVSGQSADEDSDWGGLKNAGHSIRLVLSHFLPGPHLADCHFLQQYQGECQASMPLPRAG